MDSVEAPPSLPSLTYFLTPFIQLIACSGILYGTSVLQSYYYMLNCDEDSVWMKLFVAFLFILETICTAFSFYGLNVYTVGALQNPITLFALDWTVCATPILVNVIQILVSGFYIGRMHLLTGNIYLAVFAGTLTITRAASFAYAQHGVCTSDTWIAIRLGHNIKVSSAIAMSIGPVVDGITAFAIGAYLYRSSPVIRRTRSVITWLLILTVNTGLILSAVGVCTVIAYLKMTDSLAYAGLLILSGKLYANSFLAMLNGRHALRTRLRKPVTLNTSVLGLSALSQRTGTVIQPVQIEFSQETYDSTLDIGTIVNLSKENEVNEMSV